MEFVLVERHHIGIDVVDRIVETLLVGLAHIELDHHPTSLHAWRSSARM